MIYRETTREKTSSCCLGRVLTRLAESPAEDLIERKTEKGFFFFIFATSNFTFLWCFLRRSHSLCFFALPHSQVIFFLTLLTSTHNFYAISHRKKFVLFTSPTLFPFLSTISAFWVFRNCSGLVVTIRIHDNSIL